MWVRLFLWFSNTVILLALAKKRPENSINLSGNAHCVHDKNTWKDFFCTIQKNKLEIKICSKISKLSWILILGKHYFDAKIQTQRFFCNLFSNLNFRAKILIFNASFFTTKFLARKFKSWFFSIFHWLCWKMKWFSIFSHSTKSPIFWSLFLEDYFRYFKSIFMSWGF